MRLINSHAARTSNNADGLHQIEESVKSALMSPSSITLPTTPNAPVVIWLVALTCLPEVLLTLLSLDLFGLQSLRNTALGFGAFWNGLLNGWEPLYPFQSSAMFLTYAFLHGGLFHLIGNMIVVLALGGVVVARIGQRGFLLLYAVSAIGGATAYALLSSSTVPMIGASGAVFGLIGAWKFWEWQVRQHLGSPMRPLWRSLLGLVLLNVVLWLLLSGLLAWQAHLGGFVAGVVFAAIVTPTLRYRV